MTTKKDLEALADMRLGDAKLLFNAGRYSAAYYLCGYAVETGIKACIAGVFRADVIPDKTFVNAIYSHKLDDLLGLAGLKQQLQVRYVEQPCVVGRVGCRHEVE